jgi:hypothetical protein
MLDCNIDGMDQFREFILATDHDTLVHDVLANADPAGTVQENGLLRDQVRQLDAMVGRMKREAAAPQAPAAPVDDLAQLVKQLVRTLRKAAPGNDLAEKAMDYLKRQGLQGSPLRAAPEAPLTHAGLLAAAAHIQAKAQAHAEEFGSYDPDTGAVEMSESNQEHFNTLDELAEEIRLMAEKAAPAPCDKPPAGWTCTRAPGHDGPCAAAPAAPAVDAAELGEWVATLEVDSEGGLDYETVPPCTLPPGCYRLYRAAQTKEGGDQ